MASELGEVHSDKQSATLPSPEEEKTNHENGEIAGWLLVWNLEYSGQAKDLEMGTMVRSDVLYFSSGVS